jgi:hypothetical protein
MLDCCLPLLLQASCYLPGGARDQEALLSSLEWSSGAADNPLLTGTTGLALIHYQQPDLHWPVSSSVPSPERVCVRSVRVSSKHLDGVVPSHHPGWRLSKSVNHQACIVRLAAAALADSGILSINIYQRIYTV